METPSDNRRGFLKKSTALIAGLGLSTQSLNAVGHEENADVSGATPPVTYPENPLVLFDNFHSGNRRSYSLKSRMVAAQAAGFDGFELVSIDPDSDAWQEAMALIPGQKFKVWGMHWTSNAVVDENAKKLESDIQKIEKLAEACAAAKIAYITLSLSGAGELRGPTIHESGSAVAEERHWERAYRLISAFDQACKANGIRGSLYPHTHWLCDTPQSQQKILDGANASYIGPAFCSHHWYANKNSLEIDETFRLPMMKRLNYVVLTNGRFNGSNFPAVRFDQGEIDMAWLLAKLYDFGYSGPISSQGWAIGGDPYTSAKTFVDGVKSLRARFESKPELWPL